MKKMIAIWVLLAAGSVMGQTHNQANLRVNASWKNLPWYAYPATVTTKTVDSSFFYDVKAGDTLYTEILEVMPGMAIVASVADSNAATDSIKTRIVLQMHDENIASKMTTCKTLGWDQGDTRNQGYIDGAGEWFCDVGRTSYWGVKYYRLMLIADAGHRVINDGVKMRFKFRGHVQ